MPDVYVKRGLSKGDGADESANAVATDKGEKRRISRDAQRKVKELASFSHVPEDTKFEIQEEEEEIILLVRAHVITNIPWILVALGMAVLPFILSAFGTMSFLPARFYAVGMLFWYLITIAFVFEQFLNWYFNVYIVTDERIVDVDFLNLLYKRVSEAKLDKVEDVTYSMGGIARSIFNYGNVTIQTAAEVPQFEFVNVPYPDKVVSVIRALVTQEEQEMYEGRPR